MYAEVSRNRIKLYLAGYDPAAIQVLKFMPGATRRAASTRDTAHWTLPLNLRTAQTLRDSFGDRLTFDPNLRQYLSERDARDRTLVSLGSATTATLERLPKVLPRLYRALYVGPRGRDLTDEELDTIWLNEDGSYQLADVAFGALAPYYLNGLKPGLGKTLEYIGMVYEAGLDDGKHLIIAPTSSLETVWLDELEKWQDRPVWLAVGTGEERRAVIDDFMIGDMPGFLVINPKMVQLIETIKRCEQHAGRATKHQMRSCAQCEVETHAPYPELFNVVWDTVNVDECHKNAIRNPRTLTAEGMSKLQCRKPVAASGTPMGGRTINLWGILHWLAPDDYSNKWAWANEWLDITEVRAGRATKKSIGDLRADKEDEFYRAHAPVILRRTKEECLPWLPPKQRIEVPCHMTRKQAAQYEQWALDAEVRIDGERLSATSVLDEYTRLKQFAFSLCDVDMDGNPLPTTESGKLEVLRSKLDELGIYDDKCDEAVVIFSQFTSVVEVVAGWLLDDGVPVELITGKVSGNVRGLRDYKGRKVSKRAHLTRRFQAGDIRVMILNTLAGGTAINLDRANNAFFLDRTWDPDDQEQAEDRVHRGSRIHQVTSHFLYSVDTIEEDIRDVNADKGKVNDRTLDQLRNHMRNATRA